MRPPSTLCTQATRKVAVRVGAVLLVAGVLGGACSTKAPLGAPDVVLIVVDTLRADHLTQYGYPRETSLGLADFAAHSTVFERAYSTSSWTQPSVASLFTGLLPSSHQVVVQGNVLASGLETLAERLSEAGWRSAAFSGNLFIGPRTGFGQGFDHFSGHDGNVLAYPDVATMLADVGAWLTSSVQGTGPLFLYFQPMNCHGPYRVPEERRTDLLGREPGEEFGYQGDIMQAIVEHGDMTARSRVTPEVLQSLTDKYDTAVRYSLDTVAELLARLRSLGRYDNALIIITADHGEELFDHGGFSHAYSLYEEVVRIPLWIKLPHQTMPVIVGEPVSLTDLYPTILDALDLESPEGLQGISLLPYLRGEASPLPPDPRPLLLETQWRDRAVASAVRLGPFKLIDIRSNYEGRQNVQQLFNVEDDPNEREDLAALQPEIVASLARELSRLTGARVDSTGKETVEFDEEVLKALGYVD